MDIQQLRCFLAVAEELHFGRAAERLHLSPSPVSRIVKDLERELGAELFIRGYHQVELTPAGRELFVRVPPLLAAFDRLPSDVRLAAAGDQRVVHLGGTFSAPPSVLDTVVDCAEKAHPDREVDVTLAQSSELLPALSRGELDAVVVHLPVDESVMHSLPLVSYRFRVAMRHDDPLAGRQSLSPQDLAGRTLVMSPLTQQPLAIQQLYDQLAAMGVRDIRTLTDTDPQMLAAHVRRHGHFSLTLAPENGGASRIYDDPAFATLPLMDAPQLRLGLVWLADRAADEVISSTIEAVRHRWPDGETEI
ncbi:LysR family transcriptional regulator [Streptomyces flaveolus]|uniref:LysR family transcriptional regulator n=1 Tax=Streptomyces flaveolus TaxID=67297 RepID=UPI003820F9E3